MIGKPNGRMKIGLAMPITQNEQTGTTLPYATIRELALQAEANGFDSVWIFDHLLYRFGERPTAGVWEAWTMLTALAGITTRVEIGSLVMCTAFRNPALLAKMAATLDEVSGGRLILGLGAGWHQPEFDAFGIPFDHKVDRFREALQIIVPLLREGHVDFSGMYYSAPNCEIIPRGPRPAGPPILIGAFGPRMLRLTARYANSWNTCWLGDTTKLAEPRAALEAACAEESRDPSDVAVTVGVSIITPEALAAMPEPPSRANALYGTPEEVAAGLHEYAAQGVAHVICSVDRLTSATLPWVSDVLQRYRETE